MKKKIFIGLGVILVAVIALAGYVALTTRSHSPSKTTEFSYEGLDLKVVYCQPYKKGRLIFGEAKDGALQPYGKYWRLGANEATEISFSKDIRFAGKPVKAGTYIMYAVPGPDSFEVCLNTEVGRWGAMESNYSLDVVKVSVPAESTSPDTEQFTINFGSNADGATMDLLWDKTKVTVPITVE